MNKFYETLTNLRGDVLFGYRAQVVDETGASVDIYRDRSGTRFTDGSGNIVNYAEASSDTGMAEFYWSAETGHILQIADSSGELARPPIIGFGDNYVLGNLSGDLPTTAIDGLDATLAAKADTTYVDSGLAEKVPTADLASTDVDKGAALVGLPQGGNVANAVTWVSPEMFGSVGDGEADDLAACEAARDAAAMSGAILRFSSGKTYRLSDTFRLTTDNMVVEAWGATFVTDVDNCVLLGQDSQRIREAKWYGGRFMRYGSGADYSAGYGFRLQNANWCEAVIEYVYGFEHGVSFYANTAQGTAYCYIQAIRVTDCKYCASFYSEGAVSWVNSNTLFANRLGYSSSSPDATGGYNIYIDYDGVGAVPNMNVILDGTSLEQVLASNQPEAAIYNGGIRTKVGFIRYEGTWASGKMVVENPALGGNIGRSDYSGGRGLTGKSAVDLSGSRVWIRGEDGIYFKGGGGVDPLWETQEANSNLNVAHRHRNLEGDVVYELRSSGQIKLGTNQQATLAKWWFQETPLVFGTVAAGDYEDILVTVTGVANARTSIQVTPQGHPGNGLIYNVYTNGANSVRVRLFNPTGADIASVDRTWNIEVREYAA